MNTNLTVEVQKPTHTLPPLNFFNLYDGQGIIRPDGVMYIKVNGNQIVNLRFYRSPHNCAGAKELINNQTPSCRAYSSP